MVRRIYLLLYNIVLAAVALAPSGCRNTLSQVPVSVPVQALRQEPLLVPTDTSLDFFDGLSRRTPVARYYETHGRNPIWIDRGRYSALADSLLAMIDSSPYYGFQTGSYHLEELRTLNPNSSSGSLIRKEILLTDAFLSIAADLKFGLQNLTQKNNEDSLRIALLEKVISLGGLVKNLELQEPVFSGYRALKEGLHEVLDSSMRHRMDSMSALEKIRLISINMERWRRESSPVADRYIFVNIPSFMMELVEHDSVVFSSKVIVGTPDRETPELSSTVECFTIYPYWHVPRKISVEEYLPIIMKDSTFLLRNNFDVLDRKGKILNADSVEWSKFNKNYFPVSLRQREGTENSLGVIKFVFDNPYAVFLHDTNAKRLFGSTSRAFSHGCIRMEKAVELAHYLVTGSVGAESKTISKYLKEKKQHWINLKNPIPIYTRYFTCEFKKGTLYIYRDIYEKDKALYNLIYEDVDAPDL